MSNMKSVLLFAVLGLTSTIVLAGWPPSTDPRSEEMQPIEQVVISNKK